MYLAFNHFFYFHHQETFINSKKHLYTTTVLIQALQLTLQHWKAQFRQATTTEHNFTKQNRAQFHKIEQQSTLNLSCFQEMTSHESGSVRSPQEAVNARKKRRCPVKDVLHHSVYGVNKTCDVIRQLPPLLRGGGILFERILDPQTVLDARRLCKFGNKRNILPGSLAGCHGHG